jgi:cytidyltransferase-like protein
MSNKRAYTKVVGDLFHYGHVNFFKQIKEIANYLVVQVVDDARVQAYKRLPILNQQERMAVIEACKFVDEVQAQGPKEISLDFMLQHDFSYYAYSFSTETERQQKRIDCKELPAHMVIELPYTPGISTTDILQRILKRMA